MYRVLPCNNFLVETKIDAALVYIINYDVIKKSKLQVPILAILDLVVETESVAWFKH